MKKALISIALSCLIIASCQKPYSNTGSITNISSTSLNQVFSALRTTPQGISVNAGRDTMVFGANGTMLHFYTNSFKDANGTIITSGAVNLQLVEMYKPGDMIANRATTLANGRLLQSGGQISIVATMNGQKVYANNYGVGFMQAGLSSQQMTLFYGNTNNGDSLANWAVSDTTKEWNMANNVDTSNMYIGNQYGRSWVGYVFDSASSLEYTNCDAFYSNDSPKTSVNVVVPDTSYNPTNTQVYIILPAINCAMSSVEPTLGGFDWNAATRTITLVSESQTDIVPTGMSYKIVVITNKNGNYYYWQTTGTTSAGLTVTAVMAPTTSAAVKTSLAAL